MPLKIRCPHCRKVLLAEEELAGRNETCPGCGKVFNVPIPISDRRIRDSAPAAGVALKCPHCDSDVAPGTSFCKRCKRDLSSGKRIHLSRRLRMVSVRSWTLSGVVLVGVPLLGVVSYNIYRDRFAQSDQPPAPFVAVTPRELPSHEWAERLLAAASREDRVEALTELNQMGPRAAADVLTALQDGPASTTGGRRQLRRNQAAAIEFLASFGQGRCETYLAETDWPLELQDEVVLARARLGDAQVLDRLCRIWTDGLRVAMFLSEAIRTAGDEGSDASRQALGRVRERNRRFGGALRGFEGEAFVRIAGLYWESWTWLGQSRADVLAAELFELAKPPRDDDLNVREAVDDLRAARNALEAITADAPDSIIPVAAVLLADFAPQYRSALGRMRTNLARALRDAVPADQQRITWALARISGRTFGTIAGDGSPTAVRHGDVTAALKWIRESQIANPPPLHTTDASYLAPPRLTRRVITVERQAERDLLSQMSGGWRAARAATAEWLEAGLGCTPRIRSLLNPSQRSPDYPALMGAMMIVAECNETSLRQPLTIWRQAGDQPIWVRSLAGTVLAVLDARGGEPIGRWPSELDVSGLSPDGGSGPSLADFGRAIAAGGAALIERLAENRPMTISPAEHALLVEAARAALGRQTRNAP